MLIQVQVPFLDALKRGFITKFCNFSGRASRSEFWWMMLAGFLIDGIVFGASCASHSFLENLLSIVVALPMIGVTVRRLHDIGRGGGWIFIYLIPIVGQVLMIFWGVQPSEPFTNRFGDVPNVINTPA